MKHLTLLIAGALFCLLFTSPSEARWERIEEADTAVNLDRYHYKIFRDGTYTLLANKELEILQERARIRHGLTRITYSARASELKMKSAYTLNGKERVTVPAKHIEVKPLASRGQGFDDNKQVTIGFPKVAVGSKLSYSYEIVNKKPTVVGLFSSHFTLGRNYQRDFEYTLESEVPLYWKTHDPGQLLEVKEEQKGKKHFLTFRLKSPFYRNVIEEENSITDARSLIWIAISTAKDWASLPATTPLTYKNTMESPLPPSLEIIRKEAETAQTDIERINSVTSQLAELMRYVGDWAPVEGAYHPRSLQTMVSSGFGDCKDFTSATGAILSRLGFEVHAAWVTRGRFPVLSPIRDIAAPNFNHAILYAKKDGREYWLDPTNTTSFAQGLYPDIAGRPVLLLNNGVPEMRDIPPLSAADAESQLHMNITAGKNGKISGTGTYKLLNRASLFATGLGLFHSPAKLNYLVMGWIHDPQKLLSWKLPEADLKSRIVKDFSTDFLFEENWKPIQTSAGKGYTFPPSPYVNTLRFRREERVSDLSFGDPRVVKREFQLKGAPVILRKTQACSGKSPWIDYSRNFSRIRGGVSMKEEIVLKRSIATITEIHSDEFGKLQKEISECLQPAIAVLE